MPGTYRAGLELGRLTSSLEDAVTRVRDRVWLALLDLDEALEARTRVLEERLAELDAGVDDYRRATRQQDADDE